MSDTIQQQRNAARIRRALDGCRLYSHDGKQWRERPPLAWWLDRFVARESGDTARFMRVSRARREGTVEDE